MKEKFTLMEDVNLETLLEIAGRRFPEYKSYKQTFLNGKFVCINKNALFRAIVKVSHRPKKSQTTLVVYSGQTVLGSLLVGGIWGKIIFKDFFDEVESVFREELEKRSENL